MLSPTPLQPPSNPSPPPPLLFLEKIWRGVGGGLEGSRRMGWKTGSCKMGDWSVLQDGSEGG